MEGLLKLIRFIRLFWGWVYPYKSLNTYTAYIIGVSDSSILGTGPQMFGESSCNLESSHDFPLNHGPLWEEDVQLDHGRKITNHFRYLKWRYETPI